MKTAVLAILALPLVLVSSAARADAFSDEILQRHNTQRAKHGVPPLAWNGQIAAYAQEWAAENARTNNMHHRQNNKYGENIYWTSGGTLRASTVVDAWYAEIAKYSYANPVFSSATGHFTQVVWKSSRSLGCGRAQTANGGTYVVCNYDPPGNFTNQFGANVPKPH